MLPVVALILSVAGAILGGVVLNIHGNLATSQGAYTSFCTVSEGVSCDVVLGSTYASVLGIPVGGWSILAYLFAAGLSFYLMRAPDEKRLPTATLLLGLAGAILGISFYFFFVSSFVIGVLCPMCLAMDAVNIGLFGTAWASFRSADTGRAREAFSPLPLLGAAAVATLVVLIGLGSSQTGPALSPKTVAEIKKSDPRFYAYYISQPVIEAPVGASRSGESRAPITIVEFSDYQCPYCRRAYLDITRAVADRPEEIEIIHRNFPLHADCNPHVESRAHTAACKAAFAVECASRQGKGDALSGVLFENQAQLQADGIEEYARSVGVDMGAFETCLSDPSVEAAVATDISDGVLAGVESTPTIFINGRRIKGGFSRPEQYRYALMIERERLGLDPAGTSDP